MAKMIRSWKGRRDAEDRIVEDHVYFSHNNVIISHSTSHGESKINVGLFH